MGQGLLGPREIKQQTGHPFVGLKLLIKEA